MTLGSLPSVKARRLLRALLKCGFRIVRTRGSHRLLRHEDGRTLLFAFHDRETIGPAMFARVLRDAAVPAEEIRGRL